MDASLLPFSRPKARPPPTPQALVSKFWSKYHSKAPGKVTSIFPRSLYVTLLPNPSISQSRARNAAASYEEARAECRARVRAIVAECERTNSRYNDPDFDIENDHYTREDNCLYGLIRDWDEDGDDAGSSIRAWQIKMSLDTLKDSGVLGNNRMEIDVGNLGKYIGTDNSYYSAAPTRPGSVHRLSWIFESPQFTVDGYSSTDIKQGMSGDCWWLAALATVAHRKDIMNRICVERDEECGVYAFVFNRDGEWISTVIDDNLYLKEKDFGHDTDVYDATGKKARLHKKQKQTGSESLFFAKCDDPNETWLPLLEKAFAKVHGDYQAINGGWAGNAVEDLTGGVTTILAGNRVLRKERLWREMLSSGGEDGNFVFGLGASSTGYESKRNGLALQHAYSILKAKEVEDEDGVRVRLVKIRNPWGQRSEAGLGEWHGPWSDGSREWTPYMIQKLRHKFGDDGMFWMSFEDLLSNFKWIYRTRLFDQQWTVAQQWTSVRVSWLTGYLKQRFIVEIKEEGMVVIVLSQLDHRYFRDLKGQYDYGLQFILKSIDSETPLCQVRPVHNWDRRSVNCELNLEPGTYEIIPSVIAERDEDALTVEKVVKKTADKNPQKLRQVGLQYDLAHAKGGVLDEDEEFHKRREADKEKRRKLRKKVQRINQVEDAMRRMEEAMSQMRREMNKNTAGDNDRDDKAKGKEETTTNDKRVADEKDKDDARSTKSPAKFASDESFKTAPETQGRGGEGSSKAKIEADSSRPETVDKTDDNNKKPEINREISTSQSPVTVSNEAPLDSDAPNPAVKEDPVVPPVQDEASSTSSSESDSSSDDDSDLDYDSDSSSGSEDSAAKKKRKQKPWNAVCVVGLRVYAQHADIKVRLQEHDGEQTSTGLVTKNGDPVGPTS